MIAIVDYGLGNVRAFANVYEELDVPFILASKAEDLKHATRIILPGVGSFDRAMALFQKSGLRESVEELVRKQQIPLLGICVGMQMLACTSEEGELAGLGWIEGDVRKFAIAESGRRLLLPHMGWNTVASDGNNKLFLGLGAGARFYFLHSYYFSCRDSSNSLALTDYGVQFSSAVNSGNIFGVQFHPEKSHSNGIQLLRNFAQI